MESYEPARAGLREWTVGVEELGLATFHELEMARPPLGRTANRVLSAGGRVRDPDRPATERDGPGTRSRPGKRW
ncbi:MAG TPA: hypothetical protein VJ258_06780 [Candidatus Limnocylindrales bacterium]|jgi:hypothetical protein|nr:hypothetical protein [Candidatus Limnocylindrales bacterium]